MKTRIHWGFGLILGSLVLLACQTTIGFQGVEPEAVHDSSQEIVFLGDLYFGESYQREREESGAENMLKSKGYADGLRKFKPFLKSADLVIANLEASLTSISESPFYGEKEYIHFANPQKTLKTLKDHHISVVSLANNHSLDYGMAGLKQSLESLQGSTIQFLGAGLDDISAQAPLSFQLGSQSAPFEIYLTAGFEYNRHYAEAYHFYAQEKQGGVHAWEPETAYSQIQRLRQAHPEGFIVAYPHFIKNYRWKTSAQKKLARALIDGGADLVLGHGAHQIQEIEVYQGRWIVYGLGNFIFNSPGRYTQTNAPPYSFLARLKRQERNGDMKLSLRLYPIFSDNLRSNFQPYFVSELQFQEVVQLLLSHSPEAMSLQKAVKLDQDVYGGFIELKLLPEVAWD